jgi:VIT1/CCC1 family predicted Fe2+/Mn2+ transporter
MIAVMLPLGDATVFITFVSVLVALILTGYLSAKLGGINVRKSIIRNVIGGALAMAVTYAIGSFFDVSLG